MFIKFGYSVKWMESGVPVYDRLRKQVEGALTPTTHSFDIHWLSIVNSFILVFFIASLLMIIILKVVRSDLSKYLRIPDEEIASAEDESGWKLLHSDVFRSPPHRMWFCACVGSGAHLLLVSSVLVMIGAISPFIERGALISGGLMGYLLTSFIAGYISANLYKRLGGEKWAWNIIVTSCMFLGPVSVVWYTINFIALIYKSTAALPFGYPAALLLCWLFVSFPLTVLGGIMGKQKGAYDVEASAPFPRKTNRLPRQIPKVRWYKSPWLQMCAAGFLPFSAMYIELHYVFSSLWGYRIYTLYGVLLLAVVMMILVASTVAILLTYFHLNGEDHRWWWRALICGGSVSVYFLWHSIYYYATSLRSGFLQMAFFFGYSLILAWGLFLMMGFVTFSATYFFVNYIYSRSRSD
eukprot:GHVO01063172.1.p1 GENE.GHVO01063172.1~~GHVO01063172.1.p1  ORF type:complete len:409 (+),score=36.82 GHVO01063172.1:185-1411(+)